MDTKARCELHGRPLPAANIYTRGIGSHLLELTLLSFKERAYSVPSTSVMRLRHNVHKQTEFLLYIRVAMAMRIPRTLYTLLSLPGPFVMKEVSLRCCDLSSADHCLLCQRGHPKAVDSRDFSHTVLFCVFLFYDVVSTLSAFFS